MNRLALGAALTFALLSIAGTAGCVKDNTLKLLKDSDGNPIGPSGVTNAPIVQSHLIELRVTGTVNTVTITSSDTQEGLSIVTTGLPWFQSFKVTRDTFVYLDAASDEFGIIHVQIYVDGVLFREAYSNGFNPKIAISGEYHVG